METVISMSNVSQQYKVKKKIKKGNALKKLFFSETETLLALKDINLAINKGEIVGYIGENGAGKSTSIKLMLGLIYPTKGKIEIVGKDPFKYRNQLSKDVGVLMGQKSHLWWDLPLIDSFNFLKGIYVVDEQVFSKQLEYLTETLGVEEFLYQPVRQLSLGQRMKGELIATFLHQPSIVFLDEPTIGLDSKTKQDVMEFLLDLNKEFGTTIILTTHELNDIEKICQRIILLDKGNKIYDGDLSRFLDDHKHLMRVIIKSDRSLELPTDLFQLNSVNLNSTEYIIDKHKIDENEVFEHLEGIDLIDVQFLPIDLSTLLKMKRG